MQIFIHVLYFYKRKYYLTGKSKAMNESSNLRPDQIHVSVMLCLPITA